MKKGIYALFFLAIPYFGKAQTTLQLLPDSAHFAYYDSFTGAVQFSSKSYHNYNSQNLPILDYYVYFFGPTPSFYRYNYTYNNQQLLTESVSYLSSVAITGPWENWTKDTYTYDAQERIIHTLGEFAAPGNQWVNYYQETSGFDDNTPADSSLYQLWNDQAMAWDNNVRSFNYYSPDVMLLQNISERWDADSSAWQADTELQYTYYPDGKILTQKSIDYNFSVTSYLDSFIYLPNGKIDSIYSTNMVGGGVYVFRTKFNYDSDGFLKSQITVRKAGTTWLPSSRKEFGPPNLPYRNDYSYENQANYDVNIQGFKVLWESYKSYTPLPNGQVLYVEENKQTNDVQLVTQSLDSTWLHLATVPVNNTEPINADCQFANPFLKGAGITCQSADEQSPIQIRIMGVNGQLAAQMQVMPGETWRPTRALSPGSYVLMAWQNGRYIGMKKMVVAN